MTDPITLIALTAFIAKNAPSWLASLHGTILDKGQEHLVDKGEDFALTKSRSVVRRIFHLDEKEQLRHLEQALKNATERGLVTFDTLQERDLYKDILKTLSVPGPIGETLRHEVMQLFTLQEMPDLVTLSDTYNQRQRFYNPAHQDINAGLYLKSFFTALLGELYADPYFRAQLSEALQLRAAQSMQQSLLDIINVLERIGETLEDNYTAEDFVYDIDTYTTYIERTLHNLRIVGVVPKDQSADPELNGIFVPLRIQLNEEGIDANQQMDTLESILEHCPCLVLLGGPGSGKSTATKYLAWSHAATNQSSPVFTHMPLVSGHQLPLRIELRRLSEERKRANYDFFSFATEVLLKRDGIDINPQMFKELLIRRYMLLLFDGLDEVTTLEERLELVNEIEHFALCYPGNRVLVTSRPVGYDLARISHPLFSHAQVQSFNDEQIQQFLENWYTAVLRLSPIPQREQEELNLLLTTLKENPRLHKLAENPLLLTVITALHRYERLPDRRVQVYDRCADLLLETWAKLKGTDKRWQDMRMGKDDQYACVAYIGFVLHERSQEVVSDGDEKTEDTTVDVPSRFLRQNVEDFLRKQQLIDELVEQRKEATRFIDLVQREAGLIVERGTDENGEPLYSFVHRTFQEYFAAADIYERYQQDEDPTIISTFLAEHLHDPHWKEVILLLLGKLKSKPVTNQLRQLLSGKIKSKRSQGTEILQQDLFFVCDCLIDEIKVENDLVDGITSSLSNIVKSSPFIAQQEQARQYLGELVQTRQYKGQGKKELIALVKDDSLIMTTRLKTATTLYLSNPEDSEARQLAVSMLTSLLQRPDLSSDQARQVAESLYLFSEPSSEAQQLAVSMLTSLLQRPDLSSDQASQVAVSLYRSSEPGSEAQQLAASMLTSLLQRPDLSSDQALLIAESLYRSSEPGSEARQLATSVLTSLLQRPDLSSDQASQVAVSLYQSSEPGSEAQQLAASMLTSLLQRPDLSSNQALLIAESLYRSSGPNSKEEKFAASMLTSLLQRPDLSSNQARQTTESLYMFSWYYSGARQLAVSMLTSLLQRPDLSSDQARQTSRFLYRSSSQDPEARQFATSMLISLLQRPDLSSDQALLIANFLYRSSEPDLEARQLAVSVLTSLLQRPDLSSDQVGQAAVPLYLFSEPGSEARQLATSVLTSLLQRPDLSSDQASQVAVSLYQSSEPGSEAKLLASSVLLSLLLHENTMSNQDEVYNILQRMVPQFHRLPAIYSLD